ncbi:MAG: DUF1573 domain-containing protein [Puniceicoccales bacterium]|jgi:hypothetical protein|nr:DUF1573 domain-containing protein [Puniceicoccales bacterium]
MSSIQNITQTETPRTERFNPKKGKSKKAKFLVIAFLGLFAVLLFIKMKSPESGKNVSFEKSELDFGDLECGPQNAVSHKEIKLKNGTQNTIRITEFSASCSCLKILKYPDSIPPNSEGVFKLQVTLKPKDIQERDVGVIVKTNSPDYPKLEFGVRARLKSSFYALPDELDYGIMIDKNRQYSKILFVSQFGFAKDVKIAKAVSSSKAITLGTEKITREESTTQHDGRAVFARNSEYLVTFQPSVLDSFDGASQSSMAIVTFFLSNGKKLEIPVKWEF